MLLNSEITFDAASWSFSSCEIQGIGVNIKDLKGLKVNDIQALELSKILGIIIK